MFLRRLASVFMIVSGVYNPHFHVSIEQLLQASRVHRFLASSNLSIKQTLGTHAVCREKFYLYPVSPTEFVIIFQSIALRFMCTSRSVFFYLLASGRTEIFPWTCVHKAFYGSTKSKTGFVLKPFVKMLSNLYREMQFLGMISILKDSPIYFLKSINLPTRWLPPKKGYDTIEVSIKNFSSKYQIEYIFQKCATCVMIPFTGSKF